MLGVEHQVDVAVPVTAAYKLCTRFEDFPRFMEGVEEVRHVDDTHLHWRVRLDDGVGEWDAELVEVRHEERIAWRAMDGGLYAGVVTFLRLEDGMTRVTMSAEVDDDLAPLARRVPGDLQRFKRLLES
jgi:uncharacterized membrane protein